MKKPPVHSCIRDNRFIYGTRNEADRTFICRSVPRCPKCPTVPNYGTWDSGTGRDSNKVSGEWRGQVTDNLSLQKSIKYYHNNKHINKITVIIHSIYSIQSASLLTIPFGRKNERIQVSQVSHTVPTHTGTGQWDSGTTVKPINKDKS